MYLVSMGAHNSMKKQGAKKVNLLKNHNQNFFFLRSHLIFFLLKTKWPKTYTQANWIDSDYSVRTLCLHFVELMVVWLIVRNHSTDTVTLIQGQCWTIQNSVQSHHPSRSISRFFFVALSLSLSSLAALKKKILKIIDSMSFVCVIIYSRSEHSMPCIVLIS